MFDSTKTSINNIAKTVLLQLLHVHRQKLRQFNENAHRNCTIIKIFLNYICHDQNHVLLGIHSQETTKVQEKLLDTQFKYLEFIIFNKNYNIYMK